jgi:hypothetical protein
VSNTIPPPQPGHNWSDLLALLDGIRAVAFDRSLPTSEALGRIRDAFNDYDRGAIT